MLSTEMSELEERKLSHPRPHPSQGFANQQRKEEDHKRDKQEAGPPKGVKYQPAPQVACLVAIEMGEIRNRSIY